MNHLPSPAHHGPYPVLPPTAAVAFRFYRGNDIVLYSQGEVYDGDLIPPERWYQVAAGLRVFVRLPGELETATIVGGLVLENQLRRPDALPDGSNCLLRLDLNPDRPADQEPAEGELVAWHRSQFRTLFVYWERAGRRRASQRDTEC